MVEMLGREKELARKRVGMRAEATQTEFRFALQRFGGEKTYEIVLRTDNAN